MSADDEFRAELRSWLAQHEPPAVEVVATPAHAARPPAATDQSEDPDVVGAAK